MIPVFVTGICKEALKEAMETIPTSDIKKWLDENCGPSMLAKRCQAFRIYNCMKIWMSLGRKFNTLGSVPFNLDIGPDIETAIFGSVVFPKELGS